MNGSVVIFGAGAIGRGLLAELAAGAGLTPVFVEANGVLAERLRRDGSYRVHFTGKSPSVHAVTGYRVLPAGDREAISAALGDCVFAATAVGGQNLRSLGSVLACGLSRRAAPLNILVCENWPGADRILHQALIDQGGEAACFRTAKASVERMVRTQSDALDVLAESDQLLYIDGPAWLGSRPGISGLNFCDNIDFFYARKLFMNNAGHALLAYRGYRAGLSFVHESLAVPEIRSHLTWLLSLACRALGERFGVEGSELSRHLDDLMIWRFANRDLADPISRVARNPLRKLGPEERLAGLIRLLQTARLPTEPVSRVIADAMWYRDPDDPECQELERIITQAGPEGVLTTICGFDTHELCFRECVDFYREGARS